MVRELRRTHLRLWLVLGPVLLLAVGVLLTQRGPRPIPSAGEAAAAPIEAPSSPPSGEVEP